MRSEELEGGHPSEPESAGTVLMADPTTAMRQARAVWKEGDRQRALALYAEIAAAHPDFLEPLVQRAVILREFGRLDEAEAEIQRVLERAPAFPPALMQRADIARARGDAEAALAIYRRIVGEQPGFHDAGGQAAAVLRELGRLEEADAELERVLQQAPTQRWALMARAAIARERGQLDDAVALYRRTTAAHPEFHKAAIQAAVLLRELGRLDEAAAELDRVLALASTMHRALKLRLRIASEQRDRKAALECYRRIARLRPDSLEPILQATKLLREMGRLDEADAEIDAVLQRQPDHHQALVQRGLNAEARESGSGQPWFERAIRANPDDPQPYLQLAESLEKAGAGDDAYAFLIDVAKRFPEKAEFARRCAGLDWQRGRLEEAVGRLRGLLERSPQDYSAWHRLVSWTIELGAFDEAARLLEQVPSSRLEARRQAAVLRAKLAARRFDFQSARAHQREALAHSEATPSLHESQVQYLLYSLELDQAQRHLEEAVRLKRALRGTGAEARARVGVGMRATWLNEFRLNPFVVEQLREALALPPAEQPTAFADVLREEPGHTPTAIMLMVRLKLGGAFQAWREAAGVPGWPARIPRRIVQFWDSADVPAEVGELMASWSRVCAGFEYRRFDEASARQYLKSHYHGAVVRAFNKCHNAPMKADLFRLAYLFREGGVYVDADDYCRHPIEALGRTDAEIVLYQEQWGSLGNNFIAVMPGHPVIGDALDHAVREVLESSRGDTWFTTGPGQMTRAAARQLLPFLRFNGGAGPGALPRWVVLDRHELLSCVSIHIRCRYHRSDKSWQRADTQHVRLVTARQV